METLLHPLMRYSQCAYALTLCMLHLRQAEWLYHHHKLQNLSAVVTSSDIDLDAISSAYQSVSSYRSVSTSSKDQIYLFVGPGVRRSLQEFAGVRRSSQE